LKKHLLKIISFLCFALGFFSAKSQDIHFSQFYASPLSLNPANTGNYDGDWRVMSNYRSQWKEVTKPYKTNSLGYDRQFYLYNEKISGGAIIINDKSGGANLAVTKIYLSGAYHKTIAHQNLHGGIQLGYINKSINTGQLTFPNQLNWETGYFDSQIPNHEAGLNDKFSYIDLNAGFAWSYKFKKIEPHAGLALYYINKPKESFLGEDARLPSRKVITAGAKWDISKFFLAPDILFMGHNKASEFLLGTKAGYYLPANKLKAKTIYTGIFFRDGISRNSDAFIGVIGMNINNWDIGFSYDYNISDLHVATNYRGAREISVIYTGLNTRLVKKEIPCERY